jgi:O-antigen biosynthesis protein
METNVAAGPGRRDQRAVPTGDAGEPPGSAPTDDDLGPLYDDYLAAAGRSAPGALPTIAVRTGSLAARRLLARAATTRVPVEALVMAARTGDSTVLRRSSVDVGSLADLARVMALQNRLPHDPTDSLALYDLLLDAFGPDRLPPAHRAFHAQLAYTLGDGDRARDLLRTYAALPGSVRANLRRDLANPFVTGPSPRHFWDAYRGTGAVTAAWLRSLSRLLPAPALALAPDTGQVAFDRIRAGVARRVDSDVRISVVVTAFRPDAGLLTAVRSLVHQSWANLEIIIVDDGSPAGYDAVLARCADLDGRVRLIRLATNRGTYVARNTGLDACTGRFVTFQDSDDWSHPRRVERQVEPLLRDPRLMATTSRGIAVSGDLVLTRLGRFRRHALNTSSMMLRKDAVIGRIGFFDTVRKAADSEYVGRLESAFGATAIRRLNDHPYALIRQSPDSLSRAEVRVEWRHPGRTAYASAYLTWHARIAAGEADPYLQREPASRPFTAPTHVTASPLASIGPRRCDVLFVADWARTGGPERSMTEEISALTRGGRRVGVLHLEDFRAMAARRRPLARRVQELINRGVVDHVLLGDAVEASVVVVRQPSVLQFAGDRPSRVRADRVIINVDRPPGAGGGPGRAYTVRVCAAAAHHLFGAAPRWCPAGPAVREALAASLPASDIATVDLPSMVDAGWWAVDRDGFRSDRPVVGKHWPEGTDAGPVPPGALPDSTGIDVRLLGGPDRAAGAPPTWLVYRPGEVDVRGFLHQLDFYVEVPDADGDAPDRPILEALAVGCVVLLPRRFTRVFGDAALYRDPAEVPATIARYYRAPAAFLHQSRLAQQRVRELHGPDRYVQALSRLTGPPA